jgi:hypothetical protein
LSITAGMLTPTARSPSPKSQPAKARFRIEEADTPFATSSAFSTTSQVNKWVCAEPSSGAWPTPMVRM